MDPMAAPDRMTHEEFLTHIAKALGRPAAPQRADGLMPDAPQVDDELVRLAGPSDNLVDLFDQRAREVGMEVRRTSAAGLRADLLALVGELKIGSAVVSLSKLDKPDDLLGALAGAGVKLLDWHGDHRMATGFVADVGITDVHHALAETGTMICTSDSAHTRAMTLAPPLHVAIVRKCDILPDLLDYFWLIKDLPAPRLPSSQVLITGPSKTADIEGVLVTGIHGPARVIILLQVD